MFGTDLMPRAVSQQLAFAFSFILSVFPIWAAVDVLKVMSHATTQWMWGGILKSQSQVPKIDIPRVGTWDWLQKQASPCRPPCWNTQLYKSNKQVNIHKLDLVSITDLSLQDNWSGSDFF